MIITVDGPAAAGKGELSRRLARHFDYARLDTGQIYRAVGRRVLLDGADPLAAAKALQAAELDDPVLRTEEVAQAASKVAAIPAVRQALLAFQRDFAARPPGGKRGAVLDGRDCGTVVCPEAPIKFFVTARLDVRAERRLKELQANGVAAIGSAVLRDMQERDVRDSTRTVAPLEPAKDALVLDTSDMDADAVFTAALDYISRQRNE
jgi:cytidylate kinase